MGELWELLNSAQENIGGIPAKFVEQKKEEIKRKQVCKHCTRTVLNYIQQIILVSYLYTGFPHYLEGGGIEICQINVPNSLIKMLFAKKVIYIYFVSTLLTQTLFRSQIDLQFHCFYMEIHVSRDSEKWEHYIEDSSFPICSDIVCFKLIKYTAIYDMAVFMIGIIKADRYVKWQIF